MRISQIHLTKFKINFPYNGSTRTVRQAWNKADLNKLWIQSRWAEKAANREKVNIYLSLYNTILSQIFYFSVLLWATLKDLSLKEPGKSETRSEPMCIKLCLTKLTAQKRKQ